MKRITIVAVALSTLGACAVYEVPSAQQTIRQKPRAAYSDRDIPAEVIIRCDQLGMVSRESFRLCMLRGIDRYVDTETPPVASTYQRRGEIEVVPAPMPSYGTGSSLLPCSVNPTPPCIAPLQPIGPQMNP